LTGRFCRKAVAETRAAQTRRRAGLR